MSFQRVSNILCLTLSMSAYSGIVVADSKPQQEIYYCPKVTDLVKSTSNHWGTPDGNFRNFDTSLATGLKRFVGAQWQGANLGYVTCVYQPNNPNLFYITVLFNKLTYQPSTSKKSNWTKSQKGPWYNCMSNDTKDCPFKIRPATKQGDLYQEAEQLKQESNPYDNPGF